MNIQQAILTGKNFRRPGMNAIHVSPSGLLFTDEALFSCTKDDLLANNWETIEDDTITIRRSDLDALIAQAIATVSVDVPVEAVQASVAKTLGLDS